MEQTIEQLQKDRLFIQEVINDLVKRHGLRQGDKAMDLLVDWSRELRDRSGMKGHTRRVFFQKVGKYLW
jgi:hypothetical protein